MNIKSALQTPEIRKKILITIGLVILFRLLAAIPLPGISSDAYYAALNSTSGTAFTNLLTIATGGRVDTPSLVVIGLGAYINASIVIQLLTSIIPKLEELQKEGANGRRVISQITRILTVPLSLLQGFVIYTLIRQNTSPIPGTQFIVSDMVANLQPVDVGIMLITITAGSILLMYISEVITESGIGNGSSIIIMTGILATLPGLLVVDFVSNFSFVGQQLSSGNLSALTSSGMLFIYAFFIGILLLLGLIVLVNEATRKVVINYARRVRDGVNTQSSYLPLKLNQAGVMPIIFASSILAFPTIIAQFIINSSSPDTSIYNVASQVSTSTLFNFTSVESLILYFIFIILFTYFYAFIIMKPEETSENLQKSGGFIKGIRPGASTTKYIVGVMSRLSLVGAIFLGVIALVPNLVRFTEQGRNLFVFTTIGGTSILIIVGVILDTIRQMRSIAVTRNYEKYK